MLTTSLDNADKLETTNRWSGDELIPFGKYILLNKISSGATAAVYRAKIRGEAGFERLVAVKRILPHMAGDPEFVTTFVREAKTAARLNHTNICPIYELGKVGESLYMAMEWIAGKDLGAITRRLHRQGEVMPPVIAAAIAKALCDALDYAHSLKDARGKPAGIIHRDLSPTNIVVSYEGQVKLIDFGLAKAAGRAQQTNVDALKAKLGYMSPELVKGRAPDARSDVFGVGVCLYEMVTARRLFAGKDDMATLKMVSNASVPPPSALVEDAPEELENIVMRALERNPDQRWQTAGEMSQALGTFITQTDPMFSTRQIGDFMVGHFHAEMAAEQAKVNQLLSASNDPRTVEQRRAFFASPAGAAAMAKAEIARRLSALPPPAIQDPTRTLTSEVAARNIPRAPALPSIALKAGISSHPPAANGGGYGSFEDEPTNFLDAQQLLGQKTRSSEPQARRSPAPEQRGAGMSGNPNAEATGFFDAASHARAVEEALITDAPPQPVAQAESTDEDAEAADVDDLGYSHEKTEFLGEDALSEVVVEEPQSAAALPGGGFDEEEATHIFFNKEDGIGIPDLMTDEPEPPRRGPAMARPIVAPIALIPSAPEPPAKLAPPSPQPVSPAQPPPQTAPAVRKPRRGATTLMISRGRSPTMEMRAPRRGDRAASALLVLGFSLLAIALAGLIVKTPIGIYLGLRKPTVGAIEVRTTPEVEATVKLDGVLRGRAPLRMDGVTAGTRVLELEATGYQRTTRLVELSGGTTAMVDIGLTQAKPSANQPPQ